MKGLQQNETFIILQEKHLLHRAIRRKNKRHFYDTFQHEADDFRGFDIFCYHCDDRSHQFCCKDHALQSGQYSLRLGRSNSMGVQYSMHAR